MKKYAVIALTAAALAVGGIAAASAEPVNMPSTSEDAAIQQPWPTSKPMQRAMQAHAEAPAPGQAVPAEAAVGVGAVALVLLLAL